jgi:integrase/recombinase XerD
MALKNGMDVFTLQNSLGHSSMEMVRRYLNMAQVDMGRIQRRASPVANLGA